MAEAARVKVARGEDPRTRLRGELTVIQLARLWIQARRRSWRRKSTRGTLGALRLYVVPDYGSRPANSIARSELAADLKRLAAKHPVMANRMLALWRAMYRWARLVEQEALRVTVDPTAGLRPPGGKERPRSKTYSDAEVTRILVVTRDSSRVNGDWGAFVRLLFHTGTRAGETLAMRWTDLELSPTALHGIWTIPAEATKNRRAHTIPLSSGAVSVLRELDPARYADPRVFPFVHASKPLREIGAAAGLGGPLRLHDIRRTVADQVRGEFGEATMHGILGHTDTVLTRTYGPSPRLEEQRRALEWWSRQIARLNER
jgi:integrase